jgi:hypothetical protein
MTTTATVESDTEHGEIEDRRTDVRLWFIVLVVACAMSVPVLLQLGRHQWFFLDEWSFLVNRSVRHPSTLFEAHNGHWVTVPVVVYRALFWVWGIRTYRPYQLCSVLAHLGVVLVLWSVSRRLGVRPWIAAAAAAAFIFYGSGAAIILFGFQITLTVALGCGLVHILLADHDGPVDRRDYLGLLVGLIGLMCSGVGVPMVVGVAVLALLRRNWRIALLHSVPLALIYLLWYAKFSADSNQKYYLGFDSVRFVGEMVRASFRGLGQYWPVGLALGLLALVGLGVSIRQARLSTSWHPLALPLALASSCLAFAWVTGVGRVDVAGITSASSDRYVYVSTALLIPLMALGAEALARRQIAFAIAFVMCLVIGVPGNIDLLKTSGPFTKGDPNFVEGAAYSPFLPQLPGDMRLPLSRFAPQLAPTVDWLRQTRDSGRITRPRDLTPKTQLTTELRLALQSTGRPPARDCPLADGPVTMTLRKGDEIAFSGDLNVVAVDGDTTSSRVPYAEAGDGVLDVVAGPLRSRLNGPRGSPPRLCVEKS